MVLASTTEKADPLSGQGLMGCLVVFIAFGRIGFYPSSDRFRSWNRMACLRRRHGGRICGYLSLCSVETRILLRDFETYRGGDLLALS